MQSHFGLHFENCSYHRQAGYKFLNPASDGTNKRINDEQHMLCHNLAYSWRSSSLQQQLRINVLVQHNVMPRQLGVKGEIQLLMGINDGIQHAKAMCQ
jgi:hypothetical protein